MSALYNLFLSSANRCASLGVGLGLALIASTDASAFRVIGAQPSDGTYCAGAALSCGTSSTVMRWHRNFVPFSINQDAAVDSGDATLTQNEVINAAQVAYQSWEDVPGAIINFVYAGQTSARLSGGDRSNTTVWFNPAFDSGSCVGSMGAPSGLLAMTILTEVVETGEITDCDVVFDSADTWDWNMDCSSIDVESVLVHEYGHSIGIHHTELGAGSITTRPTMFGGGYFCDAGVASGRSLETDDEGAAQCLYPDLPTVILLDKTGSMNAGNRMVDAKEAANFFVDNLTSATMAVAEFADPANGCESNVGYELIQDWTTNSTFLHSAINSVFACGGTPLYESLCCAIDKATEQGPANVLVFTDTAENTSNGGCGCTTFTDTFNKAVASDVRFYVIDMTDYVGTATTDVELTADLPLSRGDDGSNLNQLAAATGGLYFKVNEQFALTSARANVEDHLFSFGHRQQNPPNCFPEGRSIDVVQTYSGGCLPNSPVMNTNQSLGGRVTVESGMFDETIMYIQDCSGGIRIRGDFGQFPHARLGQEIVVFGRVDEIQGEILLDNVVEFSIVDQNVNPVATPIFDPVVGNLCEMIGELMTFRGYVANAPDGNGEFIFVSDLDVPEPQKLVVEIIPQTGIDPNSIVPGDYLQITGVVGTEFGHNRLRPRMRQDIVVEQTSGTGSEPVARLQSMIEAIRPNPSRDSFQIRFAVEQAARIELEVFDAQGRRVRNLVDGTQAAGSHVASWDGRNGEGNPSPSGVYFVRLSTPRGSESKHLLLLK